MPEGPHIQFAAASAEFIVRSFCLAGMPQIGGE
jgi:hypothetical protein